MPTISSAAAAAKIPLPVKIPESFTTSSPFTGTYRIILATYEKVKKRSPGKRRRAHKKRRPPSMWGSRRFLPDIIIQLLNKNYVMPAIFRLASPAIIVRGRDEAYDIRAYRVQRAYPCRMLFLCHLFSGILWKSVEMHYLL